MENLNTLFNIRFVQPIRFFKAGYFDLASLDDTIIYSKNFKLPFVPSTDFNPASLIGGHSENNLFNKIESVKYFDSTTNSFDAICTPVNITVGSLFELDHLLSLIIRNYLGEKGTCENNQDLMILKEKTKEAKAEDILVRDLTKIWPIKDQFPVTLKMSLILWAQEIADDTFLKDVAFEITREKKLEKVGFVFYKKIFLNHIPSKSCIYDLDGDLIAINGLTFIERANEWIATVHPVGLISQEEYSLKSFPSNQEMNLYVKEFLETGWNCENLQKVSPLLLGQFLKR